MSEACAAGMLSKVGVYSIAECSKDHSLTTERRRVTTTDAILHTAITGQ